MIKQNTQDAIAQTLVTIIKQNNDSNIVVEGSIDILIELVKRIHIKADEKEIEYIKLLQTTIFHHLQDKLMENKPYPLLDKWCVLYDMLQHKQCELESIILSRQYVLPNCMQKENGWLYKSVVNCLQCNRKGENKCFYFLKKKKNNIKFI